MLHTAMRFVFAVLVLLLLQETAWSGSPAEAEAPHIGCSWVEGEDDFEADEHLLLQTGSALVESMQSRPENFKSPVEYEFKELLPPPRKDNSTSERPMVEITLTGHLTYTTRNAKFLLDFFAAVGVVTILEVLCIPVARCLFPSARCGHDRGQPGGYLFAADALCLQVLLPFLLFCFSCTTWLHRVDVITRWYGTSWYSYWGCLILIARMIAHVPILCLKGLNLARTLLCAHHILIVAIYGGGLILGTMHFFGAAMALCEFTNIFLMNLEMFQCTSDYDAMKTRPSLIFLTNLVVLKWSYIVFRIVNLPLISGLLIFDFIRNAGAMNIRIGLQATIVLLAVLFVWILSLRDFRSFSRTATETWKMYFDGEGEQQNTEPKEATAHQWQTLEWTDVCFRGDNGEDILRSMTGVLQPGRLTGIFGPVGSGKSTLLNILAGRQSLERFSGNVSAAGRILEPASLRSQIAYVMQDDPHFPTETPRDCVTFAASLNETGEDNSAANHLQQHVEAVLERMHLEKCADTMMGSQLVPGLSGGERKLTSVAVELVNPRGIIFLDEPLSGLDSNSAIELFKSLKSLSEAGITVLCSVHQPSAEIFALIDDAVMVHEGETVYHGTASLLAGYLEAHGFPCSPGFNPADRLLHLLQHETPQAIQALKGGWTSSPQYLKLAADIQSRRSACVGSNAKKLEAPLDERPFCASFWRQIDVLVAREARKRMRNKKVLFLMAARTVGLSTVFASFFQGKSAASDLPGGGPNCLGESFAAMACTIGFIGHFNAMVGLVMIPLLEYLPELISFLDDRPVFLREHASHLYGAVPYFLSKFLIEMPISVLAQVVTLTIFYWTVGCHASFCILLSINILAALTMNSVAIAISCSTNFAQSAMHLGPLILAPQVLFSGVLLPIKQIPVYFGWIRFFCPSMYAMRLVARAEFGYIQRRVAECESHHPRLEPCRQQMPGDYLRLEMLEPQEVFDGSHGDAFYVAGSLVLLVCLRGLALLMLRRRASQIFF